MNQELSIFLDIIKYLLPSLVVLLITYYHLKSFFENELQKRRMDMRADQMKTLTPLQIQAYERLILFLERITPENLILRVHQPGISATQLKIDLISEVNNEYSHNLTQQLFVSIQCWAVVKVVKEEVVNLINTAYVDLGNNAVGLDLSKAIFEQMIKMDEIPTHKGLIFIKKEFDLIIG